MNRDSAISLVGAAIDGALTREEMLRLFEYLRRSREAPGVIDAAISLERAFEDLRIIHNRAEPPPDLTARLLNNVLSQLADRFQDRFATGDALSTLLDVPRAEVDEDGTVPFAGEGAVSCFTGSGRETIAVRGLGGPAAGRWKLWLAGEETPSVEPSALVLPEQAAGAVLGAGGAVLLFFNVGRIVWSGP